MKQVPTNTKPSGLGPTAWGIPCGSRTFTTWYKLQAAPVSSLNVTSKAYPHITKDPWASESPLIIALEKIKSEHGEYYVRRFNLVLGVSGA